MKSPINDKEILISGGCGSLGQTLTRLLLEEYNPKGIRIYSRDEYKHASFNQKIDQWKKENPNIKTPVSFCIGDVRDLQRLDLAMKGVDIVIHTAAMKRIEICEENPIECIETNVIGSKNVILAAINNNVSKVMNISTDKAVRPITLYGHAKAAAEKLFIQANIYSKGKDRKPRFSCCRYGNIFGSRGSVIQLFKEQSKTGEVTVTHPDMTRFYISLERVAMFVLHALNSMEGKEIFIPEMPVTTITNIAKTIAPSCKIKYTGLRCIEKIHEELITEEESRRCTYHLLPKIFKGKSMQGYYVIADTDQNKASTPWSYTSQNSFWKLTPELLNDFLNEKYAY